jgi:hypothetical protein
VGRKILTKSGHCSEQNGPLGGQRGQYPKIRALSGDWTARPDLGERRVSRLVATSSTRESTHLVVRTCPLRSVASPRLQDCAP